MWDSPSVSDFDAELYLRLIGEQMLLDGSLRDRGARRPPIAEAAGALVSLGVLAGSDAETVLEDYSLATALRDDPLFRRRTMIRRQPGRSDTKALKPRRVVPCERSIEQPHATVQVRYVSLSEDATSVAVTWRPDASRPWSGHPPQATLIDDRGTAETAHFSGGGSNEGMLGRLTTVRPLAPDTAWIELDGTRLELTGAAARFDASLERLPEQDPAHRYLWQRVAMPSEFHHESADSIEPAIDALVAAGVLAADDPLLDDVRAVIEAMPQRRPVPSVRSGHGLDRMPEPWRSLLARQGRHDGPTGSVVVGAVAPTFEGFSVAVLDLKSDTSAFQVEVEVAPGLDHRMPFDWSVQPRQLAWWARDDRGNHFLGHLGNWSSTENYSHGLIGFEPALDPRATRLEIMPTAETTRALISFTLPWSEQQAAATETRT
jgi:hypothetical protein